MKVFYLTLAAALIVLYSNPVFSQVTEEWVVRYNGPGNVHDYGNAIVVDDSGNVYVAGQSGGSGTGGDCATIKYNSEGLEQWVTRYNGPGNGLDNARSIAVDGSGNVYVAGQSMGSGTNYDYATIKYNSEGVEQWVARYNGPGNNTDYAFSIILDDSGNVYVTGWSNGSGTGPDYATIKYNSEGVERWVARYNGPGNGIDDARSIAVDGSGNVYVAGRSMGSGTNYDYATIKYNSEGVEQWAVRYNGPGNAVDYANSIAIDSSGNVYVTGRSVGSGTAADFATIKYNSAGSEQWVTRYNGQVNGLDEGLSIVVDGSGNVYVTGQSGGSVTGADYATIKYNSEGLEQWAAIYNGTTGYGSDIARSIAVDGSGNVYVTGRIERILENYDYATIKYNSVGEEQWVEIYNGPGDDYDAALSIAVDGSGNVYVTGQSDGIGTGYDYATIKYAQEPVPVELISFTASGNGNDVFLNWSTATETNNKGFEIQRLQDYEITRLQEWESMAFVNGSGTTTEKQNYFYEDKNLIHGSYSYRLKQIDFDGTFEFSNIIEVEIGIPEQFSLLQNYPNPFNPSTKISWQSPVGSWQVLKVFDVLGNEVAVLVDEFRPAGRYEATFNAGNLASGIYIYKLQAGEFIQSKKMILLR